MRMVNPRTVMHVVCRQLVNDVDPSRSGYLSHAVVRGGDEWPRPYGILCWITTSVFAYVSVYHQILWTMRRPVNGLMAV